MLIELLVKEIEEWDSAYATFVDSECITSLRECKKIIELNYFDFIRAGNDTMLLEHISNLIVALIMNKKMWFNYYYDAEYEFIKLVKKKKRKDLDKKEKEIYKSFIKRKIHYKSTKKIFLENSRVFQGFLCDEDYVDSLLLYKKLDGEEKRIIRNYYRFVEHSNYNDAIEIINMIENKTEE